MSLRCLLIIALTTGCVSQTSQSQYIQTCTGIGTNKVSCVYVPLSTIQIPGPPGPQGVPGVGTPGQNGHDGQNATIAIGTVAALSPGTNPTVTNVGTPTNAVLNFGLTTGNTGVKGDKGDKGDTVVGPVGPPGPMIPNLTVSTDGKTLTWSGTFVIQNGGTMYSCTPTQGAMTCTAQ